ncbi:hypothetical protein DMC25_18180 [Caulobacter sp. D4A]|uniref:hypothetical protein n=1 Tax=unclassified Caulobacter TaxID=2648921 RepID=UPI000D72B159|nr:MULTISPECIES: hypothetical protein [unclassified Caulobacter]PXA83279.1 hypothetical protein DMC25_18180 [Caulobacter sp. D4A]PXA91783.1 hypothetical protein DMC18_12470 [Caulobacter sp. D5]
MSDDIILPAPPPEHWDEALAQTLPGKTILVGLTFLDADGEIEAVEQFHGVILSAEADEGILVDLLGEEDDGDTYLLPPQTSNIQAAQPGTYTLANGEVLENPDFVSNWTIQGPEDPANEA